MSIGIERLSGELARSAPDNATPSDPRASAAFRAQVALWEDLLTLVVDPESPRVEQRRARR